MALPSPISVTPEALVHIKALLDSRGKPSEGIRLGVRSKGCSGLSYTLEYADDASGFEEVVELEVTSLEEGFVFHNPNEKGRCGCGESFHV